MKKTTPLIFLLFFITLLTQTAQAQETAKGIKDAGIKTHQHKNGCCQYKVIYLGGSFNNPSASSNQRLYGNYSGKTMGLTLDYSQTILRKPGFSIGFNLGGQYFTGSGDPFGSSLPSPYLVTAQISSEVTGSGNSKNSGYVIGFGPQFNIHFTNRFVFSPIFQVGYLGVTQSEFKATQTTLMQGFAIPNYTKTYDLISQTETKTSGLGFIPKARLTYMITNKIGLWAEVSYLLGPSAKNSVTTFKPQSVPNALGAYTIQQMNAGTNTTVSSDTKYNAVGFSFGVALAFGGEKKAEVVSQNNKKDSKSCFTDANLIVDKFRCCNDTLVVQGHFDINKSVNTVVDNISIHCCPIKVNKKEAIKNGFSI